jgi:hypothetical protein
VLWPIFGVLVIAAIAGLVWRAIKRQWPALDGPGLLVALAWLGLLIATAVRYSFNIYDIHGRLLYPALAPIGVLLVLGLSGWPKPKWVMGIALTIIISIAVLAPFVIIQPAYARPIVSMLPDDVIESRGEFGAYTQLLGYRLKNASVKVGEPIEIDTYWRSIAYVDDRDVRQADLALFAPDGSLVGHASMPLGTDAYPRDVWQVNEIVVTPFVISTTLDHPTLAKMSLTMPPLLARRQDLGWVTIRADSACEIDREVDVTFGGSIKLIGYRIVEGTAPRVVLCWQSIKPTPTDYTVFVHVPGDSGDSQPVGGNYPTSVWQPGEVIEDVHPLPASGNVPIPRATIGLYRLDTGERLPIDDTSATEFELIK